jgi:hypothetical protein
MHQKRINAPFWYLYFGQIIAHQVRYPLPRSKRLLDRDSRARLRNERV